MHYLKICVAEPCHLYSYSTRCMQEARNWWTGKPRLPAAAQYPYTQQTSCITKSQQFRDFIVTINQPTCFGKLSSWAQERLRVGEGRSGIIYVGDKIALYCDEDSKKYSPLSLLAVKISKQSRSFRLPREAYYYEDMEYVQSMVIPLYLRCFEAIIPPGIHFPLWDE